MGPDPNAPATGTQTLAGATPATATPPTSQTTSTSQTSSTISAPPASSAMDDKLGEPGLKALQAERDARAKAEAALAALEKQVADSKLTAEQKAAADLKAAQDLAAAAAAKALRYEVAAAKGLDLALAPRLAGTTQAELEADADALKALVGVQAPKPGVPRPDPSAGKGGSDGQPGSVTSGAGLYQQRHAKKTT